MKATIHRRNGTLDGNRGRYYVQITHGPQSFRLDYGGTKGECDWMAKMFNLALHFHDDARDVDAVILALMKKRKRAK